MNDHTHDQIKELLPAYALRILSEDQTLEIEQHLATCAACSEELQDYEAVSDSLSLAAPAVAPPATLKNRILDKVSAGSDNPSGATARPAHLREPLPKRPRVSLWTSGWQVAALLAIIALVLANVLLWNRLTQIEDRSQVPEIVQMQGTDADPDAIGYILVFGEDDSATLIVENLDGLGSQQQYQLWLIHDGQRISGGVFSVDPDGYSSLHISAPSPIRDFSSFGITIEPWGGSPGPTGVRVLEFNL